MNTKTTKHKLKKQKTCGPVSREKVARTKKMTEQIKTAYDRSDTPESIDYPHTEDALNILEGDEVISFEDIEKETEIYDEYTGEVVDTEIIQETVLGA